MSAPAPSRVEQAEISRFGIFDDEVLRELSEHGDDAIECAYPECAAPATHVWVPIPCRHSATVCAKHGNQSLIHLAFDRGAGLQPQCRTCATDITGAEVRPL